MLQLNPPIPCETPMGSAFCIAFIDYGQEHDTLWKCIITATGEVWDVPQPQVRGVKNISMGRLTKVCTCLHCGSYFQAGPGTDRRLDAKFCSDQHRKDFNSLKRTPK